MSTVTQTPKPSTLKIITTVSSQTALDDASSSPPDRRRHLNLEELMDENASANVAEGNGDDEEEEEETSEEFIKNRTARNHHADRLCDDPEDCAACGVRDCPHGAFEHYWHDGCPMCWSEKQRAKKTATGLPRASDSLAPEQ